MWLRADRGITLDGENVSRWHDLSGNRRDATQAATVAQPAFVSGVVNGHPALRFDRPFHFLRVSDLSSHMATYVFIVIKNGVGISAISTGDNVASLASEYGFGVGGPKTGFFAGDIAEFILYSKPLASSERKKVERYLSTRYGVGI